MKRRLRLRKRADIERVRRDGKSFAHPLLVLIYRRNESPAARFGVAAGKTVGGAVVRNRVKRRIRAALAGLTDGITGGVDILIIARKPSEKATWHEMDAALRQLLQRAGLRRSP